jgi:aquaporin Z
MTDAPDTQIPAENVASPSKRILLGETIGTALLMIGGPGSALLYEGDAKVAVVAACFGLSLALIALVCGPLSGGHVNPAVTLTLWMQKKVETGALGLYIAGQFIGGLIGTIILWGITAGRESVTGYSVSETFSSVANGWGVATGTEGTQYVAYSPGGYGFGSMVIVEVLFTALLCLVVLYTTRKGWSAGLGAASVGITLTLIHLLSIPVDNTSVNPVRSFYPALFSGVDGFVRVWPFFVFPLIGAALASLLYSAIAKSE